MNNIERLKASLRALTQQYIDLHDMWTYGARDERLCHIEPDIDDVDALEAQMDHIGAELIALGYQPCDLPVYTKTYTF